MAVWLRPSTTEPRIFCNRFLKSPEQNTCIALHCTVLAMLVAAAGTMNVTTRFARAWARKEVLLVKDELELIGKDIQYCETSFYYHYLIKKNKI